MKAIITNYRYWVLSLLGAAVFIGLIAIPQDGIGFLAYIAILFGSKIVALVALVVYCLLYIHWHDNGEIPELANIIDEDE